MLFKTSPIELITIKEIKKMAFQEREKKLKDLKLELIKSKANASKTGSKKTKEIKKIIARILTFNNQASREEIVKKGVKKNK